MAQFIGTSGPDLITGSEGDDVIFGGLGDDRIDGGEGVDTATFGGTLQMSGFAFSDGGVVTVTGPEGSDQLRGIERIRFADGMIAVATASSVNGLYATFGGRGASGAELAYWTGELSAERTDLAKVRTAILDDPLGRANTDAVLGELYRDYLGRRAGAEELAYWHGQVRAGVSFAQVREGIILDPAGQNFAADRIAALYTEYLGRAAGAGEVSFWTNEVRIGTSFAEVRAALLDDPSGRALAAGQIDTIYRDYGGRAASVGEIAFWRGEIRAGSDFLAVREAVLGDALGTTHTRSALSGLYTELFGRNAGLGEQDVWHELFRDGFTLDAARSVLTFDGGSDGRVDKDLGTSGADVFAFASGERHLAIDGFDPFLDRIDLRALGLTGIDPLDPARAREITTLDGGTDVLITLDATHDLLLRGVALGQLGADGFLL